jgi:regulator of replication initiation timing
VKTVWEELWDRITGPTANLIASLRNENARLRCENEMLKRKIEYAWKVEHFEAGAGTDPGEEP